MLSITLKTKRLILRPFSENDAFAASYNSRQPSVSRQMPDMILADENAAMKWIKWLNSTANTKQPWQVLAVELKEENKCIGLVGVIPQPKIQGEIEILFAISDEYQNCGFATEASKELINWFFTIQHASHLCAIVKTKNISSQKVIEKLGFVYIEDREIMYDNVLTMFKYYKLHHKL